MDTIWTPNYEKRVNHKKTSLNVLKSFTIEPEKNQRLEHIYASLDSLQQESIQKEEKSKLDSFWRSQLNKEKAKGELSKILQYALDEKKRQNYK